MRFLTRHKLSFTSCLRLCFALLLMMIALFFYYVWSEKQIDAINNQRYATRLLIDEFRGSSDELTSLIRSYAVTGDQTYLRQFKKIIAIREGKLPGSLEYDFDRWGFIKPDNHSLSSSENKVIPLLKLMKRVGFTQQELALLNKAKEKSDQLTKTELTAAALLQSLAANDHAARQQAVMMVFDQSYQQQKDQIMALVDETDQLCERRTQTAVDDATQWAWLMRMTLIGFGSALLALIVMCEKLFLSTLGAAPEAVYRSIQWLGKGYFESLPTLSDIPKNSVMSHLAQTQIQLKQLEDQRKQSQQSLQLMSKVFSEAQEGIFLTDAQGIVIDVNLAYLCIIGYSRKESLGQYAAVLNFTEHPSTFYVQFWEQLKNQGRWRGEIWNRKKNGTLFAAILNFSAVNDDDGNLLCYLGMVTDITQLKMHQQEIEEIAFHDALTSLPNRPLLADRMHQALARVDRNKDLLAVACLDLDGFKSVNDTYGHSAGDSLLIEVAHRLLSSVRSCDTVARLGGDEFAILLSGIESREHCEVILQRILLALATPYHINQKAISSISGSMGYTLFPMDNVDPDTLLRHADQAMYIAKQAGKNRFHYFDIREDKRIQANWLVITRIEKALKNGELCLYVQPKVNLKTGEVVGAETLIRWQHPIRGTILPGEFLPLTEDCNLSISIGEWVIREALQIMQNWREQGLLLPLSINISARQIRQGNFREQLSTIIKQFPDMPPGQLEIEIIESAALDDLQQISQLIASCKILGVNFALDDFGTGYSSLTYLKRLAVTTLKIDQSFVHDLLDDENDLAIVRGVVGLAKAFNAEIIAEGLENWQQARCLLDMGCFIAQGYVIAHPMPANDFLDWRKHFQMPDLTGAMA